MAVPAAPTIRVRNRPSLGIVEVRITPVDGATSYKLYRDTHALPTTQRGSAILAATVAAGPTFDAVAQATGYWYRAKATNLSGDSAFGPQVRITTASYVRADPSPTNAAKHARH